MRISDWSSDVCSSDLPRYEADDLIGSSVHRLREHGLRSVIVSADKDLSQLLGSHDEQWDYARNQRWGHGEVKARYGVHAHQMADFLGLAGDATDNIPGVPGIGSKTAAALLAHFATLDAQIGRVLCSERVGPYVIDSVVAVTLKKK